MIEGKAIQRIRHAEMKAKKIEESAVKDSQKKIQIALKSADNRVTSETEWAKRRALKIISCANTDAEALRSERVDKCNEEIRVLGKKAASRKKKAHETIINMILREG